jgi:hypothetical protein
MTDVWVIIKENTEVQVLHWCSLPVVYCVKGHLLLSGNVLIAQNFHL